MMVRRIVAAAVSVAAVLAFNVGVADTASAKGSQWSIDGKVSKQQTLGTQWG